MFQTIPFCPFRNPYKKHKFFANGLKTTLKELTRNVESVLTKTD